MPTVITKKSTVAAKVPLSTDLQVGELAVNTADKKLYSKHSDNSVVEIGFNPAVPGPIGATTPSTINTTDITAINAVVSGGTRTASGSTLVINETLSNAAVIFPGALVVNQTHTASAAGSLITDLRVDGSSKYAVRKDGRVLLADGNQSSSSAGIFGQTATTTGIAISNGGGNPEFAVWRNGSLMAKVTNVMMWNHITISLAGDMGNTGVKLWSPSAGLIEINSGTNGTYRDLKLRNIICTGNISTALSAKTSDYTLTANDGTITADSTSTAITLTLPTAVGHSRIHAFVKTAGANAVTIDGNASETIDGSLSVTLTDRTVIQSNGTNWVRIA